MVIKKGFCTGLDNATQQHGCACFNCKHRVVKELKGINMIKHMAGAPKRICIVAAVVVGNLPAAPAKPGHIEREGD